MKKYLLLRWKENLAAGILLTLNVLLSTMCTFVFMDTINAVTAGKMERILCLLGVQALLWVLVALTYYFGGVVTGLAHKGMQNDMRREISEIMIRKNYQEFEEREIGDYLAWYSNNVGRIDMWAYNSFFAMITCVAQIIITGISMFLIHWVLVLVAFVGALFLLMLSILFEKPIAKRAGNTAKASEQYYSGMKNLLSGYTVMKNFHIMNQFVKQADECSETYADTEYRYTKIQIYSNSWLLFCNALFRVLVIGACAILIFKGKLGIATMIGVSNFLPEIFDGFTNGIAFKNSMIAAKPFFEKFEQERQSVESKPSSGIELKEVTKGINIRQLNYHYGDKQVLDNLSFEIEAGKKYAIIGASGSGKTTLMKILLGQLGGYEGEVFYDNVDGRECNPETITDQIAYIEQSVYLFDTTIRNNITLWEDIPNEKMEYVLKESALFEDMNSFPMGLETEVGENGKNLSGGQRQRIAVARALIHDKKILFVDEGTSALDQKNANIIETKLLKNKELTLLLISHHLEEERKKQFDGILELKSFA